MKDRFELCEEHGDTKIYYDFRLRCPLCDAQEEIEKLKEQIEQMEEQE
jgi:hypothetical protein